MSIEVCRLCLKYGSSYINLSGENLRNDTRISSMEIKTIRMKLKYCVDIQISLSDELSKNICFDCVHNLDTFYTFKKMCKNSEEVQRTALENIDSSNEEAEPQDVYKPKRRSKDEIKKDLVDPKSNRRCDICKKTFKTVSAYKSHSRTHQEKSDVQQSTDSEVLQLENIESTSSSSRSVMTQQDVVEQQVTISDNAMQSEQESIQTTPIQKKILVQEDHTKESSLISASTQQDEIYRVTLSLPLSPLHSKQLIPYQHIEQVQQAVEASQIHKQNIPSQHETNETEKNLLCEQITQCNEITNSNPISDSDSSSDLIIDVLNDPETSIPWDKNLVINTNCTVLIEPMDRSLIQVFLKKRDAYLRRKLELQEKSIADDSNDVTKQQLARRSMSNSDLSATKSLAEGESSRKKRRKSLSNRLTIVENSRNVASKDGFSETEEYSDNTRSDPSYSPHVSKHTILGGLSAKQDSESRQSSEKPKPKRFKTNNSCNKSEIGLNALSLKTYSSLSSLSGEKVLTSLNSVEKAGQEIAANKAVSNNLTKYPANNSQIVQTPATSKSSTFSTASFTNNTQTMCVIFSNDKNSVNSGNVSLNLSQKQKRSLSNSSISNPSMERRKAVETNNSYGNKNQTKIGTTFGFKTPPEDNIVGNLPAKDNQNIKTGSDEIYLNDCNSVPASTTSTSQNISQNISINSSKSQIPELESFNQLTSKLIEFNIAVCPIGQVKHKYQPKLVTESKNLKHIEQKQKPKLKSKVEKEVTIEENEFCSKLRAKLNRESITWLADLHKEILHSNCPKPKIVFINSNKSVNAKINPEEICSIVKREETNKDVIDASIIRVKTPKELGADSPERNSLLIDHTY